MAGESVKIQKQIQRASTATYMVQSRRQCEGILYVQEGKNLQEKAIRKAHKPFIPARPVLPTR